MRTPYRHNPSPDIASNFTARAVYLSGEAMSKNLVVVVTGASAGLGRAIAHGFAKRGASIGLLARNPEALNAAKSECEALGGRGLVLPVDVSEADAVETAASRVEEEFGPIDVWVNDAMVSVFSPVKELEPSD
jgi:NADP-dependent 3-hydroxy acid dehydrogenase YdfG